MKLDDFLNVIKKDPQVQVEIKGMIVKNSRLPYDYQSKLRYDTLDHTVNFKEMIILMDSTIVGIDLELKMKISRIKNLESRLL